jgi:hypothetical protein
MLPGPIVDRRQTVFRIQKRHLPDGAGPGSLFVGHADITAGRQASLWPHGSEIESPGAKSPIYSPTHGCGRPRNAVSPIMGG